MDRCLAAVLRGPKGPQRAFEFVSTVVDNGGATVGTGRGSDATVDTESSSWVANALRAVEHTVTAAMSSRPWQEAVVLIPYHVDYRGEKECLAVLESKKGGARPPEKKQARTGTAGAGASLRVPLVFQREVRLRYWDLSTSESMVAVV